MNRPPLEWNALVEGQQFGPYGYHVDQQVVASLRASVGDDALVLIDGEAVAPATILTVPFLQLLEWRTSRRLVSSNLPKSSTCSHRYGLARR